MKKYLPLALGSFVAMMAVLWCVTWYIQARSIETWAVEEMKNLNPALGSMQATSVKTSGFPMKMVVTVTNPTVTIHMKQALTMLDKYSAAKAGNSAGVLATPDYAESTLQYGLQGTLTIALNALSDKMDLTYEGSATTQLAQAESAVSLAFDYNGPSTCTAKLQRGFTTLLQETWDLRPFFTPEGFAANIKDFSCEFPGSITTNTVTNQMVSSMGPLSIAIANDPEGDMTRVAARIKLTEYEVLPAGDEVMNQFRRALLPVGDNFVPVLASLYGKQSLSADITAEVPQDAKQAADKPMRVELKDFTFANAASTSKGNVKFSSIPTATDVSGEFVLNLTTEFTGRQAEISRMNIAEYARQLIAQQGEARAAAEAAAKDPNRTAPMPILLDPALAANPKRLEETLYTALPDVSQLGTLRQNVSFSYNLKKGERNGSVTISNLDVSTRDYGVSGTGQGSISPSQMLPTVAANLTCRNCSAMFDAMEAYVARAQSALFVLSGNPRILPPPEMIHGIAQLLEAIGVKSATAPLDLQFTISSNNGALDVNGKSLGELMEMTQHYLQPATPAAPAR